ncbi:MAG: DNA recombination protein RmuC, partial [Microbacterium sp.]
MDALTIVIALVALTIGAAIGWLVADRRAGADRARVAAAEAEVAGLREQLARADDLRRDAIEHERREQGERSAVLQALSPVKDTLTRMQNRVDEMERQRQAQLGTIQEQLRQSSEADEKLRATTESLAGALRSHTTRGLWGETQLRRVVESAGLLRHVDFDTQATISDGASRPDMIVRLPGGAALAVDAKAPLGAFLDAAALPDEDERRAGLMKQHVKSVRVHIDQLSSKQYWTGLDVSPEFVICFIPSEAVLATALDADPSLLDYAFGKRVALASPVNLWAVLKTVSYTWTQHE